MPPVSRGGAGGGGRVAPLQWESLRFSGLFLVFFSLGAVSGIAQDDKIDCDTALELHRAGRAPDSVIRAVCPPEVVATALQPREHTIAPADIPEDVDAPIVLQGDGRLELAAKRVVKTAVRSAARSSAEALADYAVRNAIQGQVHRRIRNTAARQASRQVGGDLGRAISGLGGWGRSNGKPGYEFVVTETARAATWAAAGEAMFFVPRRFRRLRLVRLGVYEGVRVVSSRPGRVSNEGVLLEAAGRDAMDEIILEVVERRDRGTVYRAGRALETGNEYALVDEAGALAYDFGVR